MTSFKLKVKKLFDGKRLLSNQTVWVKGGKIERIEKSLIADDVLSGMLVPGYIDVQVNGGGGYLFNQSPTLHTIEKIGLAHQQWGTTGWLPTLITDSIDKMTQAADAVAKAIKKKMPGVLGIHFEGPFLSVEKKGVHPRPFIRHISDAEIAILTRRDLGKVVITLAPEMVPTQQIERLVSSGVIVCLGHSNATFEQTCQALKAGASGFTHLFNAMSSFQSREPGMVGAALLDQNSYAGLIMDGIHVHPESARLAVKVKQNIMLVTDAMPTVGSDKKVFDFFGETIQKKGLTLTNLNGQLAGSTLDMNTAVKNAITMLGIDVFQAVNLASKNPARFLGLADEYGHLNIGGKASMILLDADLNVFQSWIDGVKTGRS